MFDSVTFAPSDGGATVTLATTTYPVGSLSCRYETASEEQPQQDHSGQHDTPAPVRRMTMSIIGQIVGSSATDYWSKRTPLVGALLPPQGTVTVDGVTGTLSVTPTGGTAIYTADVVVTALDLPISPGENVGDDTTTPTSSGFVAQMRCNYGYWQHNGTAVRL